jgi:xylose isomerase
MLFSHPRYTFTAQSTSCNADVFAYRRRAGEEGHGSDAKISAAKATRSGADAKVT